MKSQVLRIASAALIAVAVAKVFIFDMSELEGVLRALSFIGLGAVLIGIGLFYQRLLTTGGRSTEAAHRFNRRIYSAGGELACRSTGRSWIGQCTIAAKMPSATPSHQTGS